MKARCWMWSALDTVCYFYCCLSSWLSACAVSIVSFVALRLMREGGYPRADAPSFGTFQGILAPRRRLRTAVGSELSTLLTSSLGSRNGTCHPETSATDFEKNEAMSALTKAYRPHFGPHHNFITSIGQTWPIARLSKPLLALTP